MATKSTRMVEVMAAYLENPKCFINRSVFAISSCHRELLVSYRNNPAHVETSRYSLDVPSVNDRSFIMSHFLIYLILSKKLFVLRIRNPIV